MSIIVGFTRGVLDNKNIEDDFDNGGNLVSRMGSIAIVWGNESFRTASCGILRNGRVTFDSSVHALSL